MNKYLVLTLLTLSYVVGEIAHFLLGVMSRDIARDIGYGEKACTAVSDSPNSTSFHCSALKTERQCLEVNRLSNGTVCDYLETGQGLEYQILAGPTFMAVFTVGGILCAFLSEKFHRPYTIAACTIIFSTSAALMSLATAYWHLVVLRMLIALGESGCRPIAAAMISDLFESKRRGLANGIFSLGVMFGYGLSFAIGNYVPLLDLLGLGWRMAFVIGCAPGIVLGICMIFIKDQRTHEVESSDETESLLKSTQKSSYVKRALKSLCQPVMLLLVLGAALRHTGGETLAYNTQLYFQQYFPEVNPGLWLTMASIVGGSLGLLLGGQVSDLVVRRGGLHSRLAVLALSQFLAIPFSIAMLSTSPPVAFIMLLFYYIFSETWFAILFTVLTELTPSSVQAMVVALFIFVMNNIGGNLPIVVEPLRKLIGFREAIVVMWPVFILAGGLVFVAASTYIYLRRRSHEYV